MVWQFLMFVLLSLALVAWAGQPGLRRAVRQALARVLAHIAAWVTKYLTLHAS